MESIMSEKKKAKVLLSQLEDALEERQDNDRRKNQKPLTEIQDRRKADRRETKKQTH
jgi:cytidylate kinase